MRGHRVLVEDLVLVAVVTDDVLTGHEDRDRGDLGREDESEPDGARELPEVERAPLGADVGEELTGPSKERGHETGPSTERNPAAVDSSRSRESTG